MEFIGNYLSFRFVSSPDFLPGIRILARLQGEDETGNQPGQGQALLANTLFPGHQSLLIPSSTSNQPPPPGEKSGFVPDLKPCRLYSFAKCPNRHRSLPWASLRSAT